MEILGEFIIYLLCAAIAVPIFSKLGFGSVLGYLAAGVVVGPYGLGLIGEVESKLHFAELGVVLLLFIIGLELQPSRLWVMRHSIFGLGTAQVVGTAVVIALAGRWLGDRFLWPQVWDENRYVLEPLVGRIPEHLCYPNGDYHPCIWPWLDGLGVEYDARGNVARPPRCSSPRPVHHPAGRARGGP